MKKIIITAIVSVFTNAIVSPNLQPVNAKSVNTNQEHLVLVDFRKDIGSAD